MVTTAKRDRRLPALAAVVATICSVLGACVVALGGFLVKVFACDSGCSPTASDWSDRADAWQWNVVLILSLATLVAALLLMAGVAIVLASVGRGKPVGFSQGTLLTGPPFAVEIALLGGLWMFAAPTHRDDLKEQLAWLTVLLITSGLVSIRSALRAGAAARR